MGWLFAVALGLQERRRSKVIWALGPIALGHLVSIAAVVAVIGGLRLFFAIDLLRPIGAAALILFGLGRDAGECGGAGAVVVPDGVGAWRGPDAVPDIDRDHAERCAPDGRILRNE